ncbi:hypothetical protein ACMU6081_01635 [Achromobacter mucicolens]
MVLESGPLTQRLSCRRRARTLDTHGEAPRAGLAAHGVGVKPRQAGLVLREK